MTAQPNPAVARLTPEPSAPPVVSRHVSLAQELLVAAVGRQTAETARNMCHWVQGVGNAREESHEAFHYGNVCPYEAVAAVLSGQPDPRDTSRSHRQGSPSPNLAERRIAAVLEAIEVGREHGSTSFDLTNLTRMLTEDYPSVSD